MPRQLFEYHPVLGYRFIPGLRARVGHEAGGYLVRVNNRGFRCNHDFAAEKAAGVRRVLVFGDSFTAGDGVSNEQRYSDILESAMVGLEVYNFGLPGSGTDQQYLAYLEFARAIDHDLLVIAVLVENIRRIAARYRPFRTDEGRLVYFAKPFYEVSGSDLVLNHNPVPREPVEEADLPASDRGAVDRGGRYHRLRRWTARAGLRDVAQWASGYQPVPEYDRSDHPAWRLMAAILRTWIRGHPGSVLLMPLPLYQHVEGTSDPGRYQTRFREIARETGCALHDPLPDLRRYPAETRRAFRFSGDVHLSPSGHAAIAASLTPAVRDLLAQPATRAADG